MIWYGLASILPAAFLILAATIGGVWPVISLLSVTLLVFTLDRVVRRTRPEDHDHDGHQVSFALAATHLSLLPVIIWSFGNNPDLTPRDIIVTFLAAGIWFGQVSHSNAHEMIHRAPRMTHRLGRVLYASLFYGHHATAHVRVHHIHAATDSDPNSARLGETFWAFLIRCAAGEYTAGLRAENAARARKSTAPHWAHHPYVRDAAISGLSLALAIALSGAVGALTLVLLAAYAAWQLMLADYVQHYGLRRRILPNGKAEPVGPHHSWNAPQWYSNAMMLNAPHHSDHHMHPGRPFPALKLDHTTMPTLPRSLPVMAAIALVPPLWRRLMDKRAARWCPPDPAHSGTPPVTLAAQ